jgi:hypothetical protein
MQELASRVQATLAASLAPGVTVTHASTDRLIVSLPAGVSVNTVAALLAEHPDAPVVWIERKARMRILPQPRLMQQKQQQEPLQPPMMNF